MRYFVSVAVLLLMISACSTDHSVEAKKDVNNSADNQQPSNNDTNTETEQYPVLEPINCTSLYELEIDAIFNNATSQQSQSESQTQLIDQKYTDDSYWQPESAGDSVIFKLAKPSLVSDVLISWLNPNIAHYFDISVSDNGVDWTSVIVSGQSNGDSLIATRVDFQAFAGQAYTARFVRLTTLGNEQGNESAIIELQLFGCQQTVTHNIELIDWYLSVPTDVNNNGKSDSIYESELAAGYFDPRFFYQSLDGGLVFRTNVRGFKTSENTKYIRTELREMLRRGNKNHSTQGVNKNNWVFSSAPQSDQDEAGGIDGHLAATLRVDHVTSTGEDYQIGRVIIGQIHANDDEPIRLYYRKLPNNTKGSLYFAHEVAGGDENYYMLLGSRDNNASDPADGIALGERFTYEIDVNGNNLSASILKDGKVIATNAVDMTNSGYDQGGQYMYFKAGVYNQNNSGDNHDYAQVTIFELSNSHN